MPRAAVTAKSAYHSPLQPVKKTAPTVVSILSGGASTSTSFSSHITSIAADSGGEGGAYHSALPPEYNIGFSSYPSTHSHLAFLEEDSAALLTEEGAGAAAAAEMGESFSCCKERSVADKNGNDVAFSSSAFFGKAKALPCGKVAVGYASDSVDDCCALRGGTSSSAFVRPSLSSAATASGFALYANAPYGYEGAAVGGAEEDAEMREEVDEEVTPIAAAALEASTDTAEVYCSERGAHYDQSNLAGVVDALLLQETFVSSIVRGGEAENMKNEENKNEEDEEEDIVVSAITTTCDEREMITCGGAEASEDDTFEDGARIMLPYEHATTKPTHETTSSNAVGPLPPPLPPHLSYLDLEDDEVTEYYAANDGANTHGCPDRVENFDTVAMPVGHHHCHHQESYRQNSSPHRHISNERGDSGTTTCNEPLQFSSCASSLSHHQGVTSDAAAAAAAVDSCTNNTSNNLVSFTIEGDAEATVPFVVTAAVDEKDTATTTTIMDGKELAMMSVEDDKTSHCRHSDEKSALSTQPLSRLELARRQRQEEKEEEERMLHHKKGSSSSSSNDFTSLLFSLSNEEGEILLHRTHFAERRRTLARIALRNIPDDRLRLSKIAANVAGHMLVSYDAFTLGGFSPFIVHDRGEWLNYVANRDGLSEVERGLMSTCDRTCPSYTTAFTTQRSAESATSGHSGASSTANTSNVNKKVVLPRLDVFISHSGSRSFIQVLFDCFANSVKFFTEPVTFFAALCYFDRIHAYYYATLVNGIVAADAPAPMRVFDGHYLRLFLTLMIISCKMHADLKSTITYFRRQVPGVGLCGITSAEIVLYEREILQVLGFNASVDKTHIRSILSSFASPEEKYVAENLLFY